MNPSARGRRNKRAGRSRELLRARNLKRDGWEVAFVPRMCVVEGCDHDGCNTQAYDILACRAGEIVLEEVKSTRTPWATFGPAKREALKVAGSRSGGRPRLVWWPYDRGGIRIYEVDEWPS